MKDDLNQTEKLTLEDASSLQELCDYAQADSENIDIPDSLSPENVEKMLKEKQSAPKKRRSFSWIRYVSVAASVAVVVAAGVSVGTALHRNSAKQAASSVSSDAADNSTNEALNSPTGDAIAAGPSERPANLGGIFHLASSMEDIMALVTPTASYSGEYQTTDIAAVEDNSASTSAGKSQTSYSSTNLQVEGVDEGDTIKTDGTYIYQLADYRSVHISRADSGSLTEVSSISFEQSDSDFSASELYLDSDRNLLIVIGTCYNLSDYDNYPEASEASSATCDKLASTSVVTYVYSYDVSDPSDPVLCDAFSQDGYLNSSRLVDGYLYLFTGIYSFEYYICDDEDEMHSYTDTDDPDDAMLELPYVDGCQLSCSDIYIPDETVRNETLISAIGLSDDGSMDASDALSIMNPYSNLYMSADSIYLYYESWPEVEANSDEAEAATVDYMNTQTVVAKFSYENGAISADAATTVAGYLSDTFAISENDGYLYLLTQQDEFSDDGNYTWHNTLRVLDSSLNSCGEIAEIAPDEEIYAARYIGDMAYFITYKEIDPLFVADLSDPENPKLLGNVEISGFSEYLHPFGENLLLGIGFDTVDNGYGGLQTDTVKLVMFDTSDPLNPAVLDAIEIPNSYYSEAIYDYKKVLVNTDTGLIGLPVALSADDDDPSGLEQYDCFYWDGSQFVTAAALDPYDALDASGWECRGSYIGDWLYLSCNSGLVSYDMKNDFSQKSLLKYE